MPSALVYGTADRRDYRAFWVYRNGPELLCYFTHLKQYTLARPLPAEHETEQELSVCMVASKSHTSLVILHVRTGRSKRKEKRLESSARGRQLTAPTREPQM